MYTSTLLVQHAKSLTRLSQLNINNGVAFLVTLLFSFDPNGFSITQKAFEKIFGHSASQVNCCQVS